MQTSPALQLVCALPLISCAENRIIRVPNESSFQHQYLYLALAFVVIKHVLKT
jgi:hypothetical protein